MVFQLKEVFQEGDDDKKEIKLYSQCCTFHPMNDFVIVILFLFILFTYTYCSEHFLMYVIVASLLYAWNE